MPQENILFKPEAAKQLKISLATLNRVINCGKIKQVELSKRRRGILQSEINRYLVGDQQPI